MHTLEFSGQVTDGKLPAAVSQRIAAVLRQFEGKRVVVTVKEQKRRRSLQANSYLWGVVYPPIVEAFRQHGNVVDAEDVHLFCKQHVGKLKQVLVTPDGEILQTVGSTRNLSTANFSEYIQAVIVWAAETLGISIPSADEWAASSTN